MMKKKSALTLPDFDTEGFIFELSADLDCPDKALIILNIRNQDKTCCFSLALSNQGLDMVSELLLDSSHSIEDAYEAYWKYKNS